MTNIELKGFKGLKELYSIHQATNQKNIFNKVEQLPLELLKSGQYQPRKNFNIESIQDLSNSIRSQGIIQPIIVRRMSEREYEIISGERRFRAAQHAGLTHVPALIKEVGDDIAMAFSLIENIQRESLNPIEEAVAFERFSIDFSMTHDEISNIIGKSRSSITNTLRLLQLHDEVKQFLVDGYIDMGHARAILSLPKDKQIQIANIIVEKKLSVREVEKLVSLSDHNNLIKKHLNNNICKTLEEKLKSNILRKVRVHIDSKDKGRVVIYTDSLTDINWVIDNLRLQK